MASSPNAATYRIGLIASPAHQEGPASPLAQLLANHRPKLETLQPELVIPGSTFHAIKKMDLLPNYKHMRVLEGGLVKLVSRIVDTDPSRALDAVIYLIDPTDSTSTFPEVMAMKRQCVIHEKPFLSTLAGALEWLDLESIAVGAPPDRTLDDRFNLGGEGIALIAHNADKRKMVSLVEKHFQVLDAFGKRYATATTGGLLNTLAERLKGKSDRPWVKLYRSGPEGGDAQVAELIVDRECRRVLFLEDPNVARQHEADIQLLERTVSSLTDFASCMSDAKSADRWLTLIKARQI